MVKSYISKANAFDGMETLYDLFKIREDAPPEIIRAAYKALSSMYHPDKNPGDALAAEMMKKVNKAYAILRDPDLRARYDDGLRRARTEAKNAASQSDARMNDAVQPESPPADGHQKNTGSKTKDPWWVIVAWCAFYVVVARLIGLLGILVVSGVLYWLKPKSGIAVALIASLGAGICVAFFIAAVVRPELNTHLGDSTKAAALVTASTNGVLLPERRLPAPESSPKISEFPASQFTYEQAYSQPSVQVPPVHHEPRDIELAKLDQWHPSWRQKVQSPDFHWWLGQQDVGVRNSFATTESATQLNVILKQYDQWVLAQSKANPTNPRIKTPDERWNELKSQRQNNDAAEALSRQYSPLAPR